MIRRKLGILILIGITVLAGTQEAVRQFHGLKSSLTNLTRASLWSGLIVYAQPVTDGKLPSPQIYYLMPQPSAPNAPGNAILVDNRPDATTPPKSDAKNNHAAEVASNRDAMVVAAMREVEDAAKSELVLGRSSLNLAAANVVPATKPEKARVYEEIAKTEAFARRFKFKEDAEVIAKVFVKEFDAAKLDAELARLALSQEQLENQKLKSVGEAEKLQRRIELRVMRRHARPERIKNFNLATGKREIVLPEMSSIGCEKTLPAKPVAAVEAAPAALPVATMDVRIASEPLVVDFAAPVSPVTSTSWALGCDNEPEQK